MRYEWKNPHTLFALIPPMNCYSKGQTLPSKVQAISQNLFDEVLYIPFAQIVLEKWLKSKPYPYVMFIALTENLNWVFFYSILGCEFPQEWQGEWNLEGDRESLHISVEDFGLKGFCLKHEDDIYVIYKRYVPGIYKYSDMLSIFSVQ